MPHSSQSDCPTVLTFGKIFSDFGIEAVRDPDRPYELRLHSWKGSKFATVPSVRHRRVEYKPSPIAGALTRTITFPVASISFGTSADLARLMLNFVSRYAGLAADTAAVVVTFAIATWFPDCLPASPILELLGPEREIGCVLRLLRSLCRRAVLLGDVDVAALRSLPPGLDATLLLNQRHLDAGVRRVLRASSNRHVFLVRGNSQLHVNGAKAFSADAESADLGRVRLAMGPILDSLPILSDSDEMELATQFQSKLLRYRMMNFERVRGAEVDVRAFVPPLRDQAHAWLSPLCDCDELTASVLEFLLCQNQEREDLRLSDDRSVTAEAALSFCHKPETGSFFVGEMAEVVNDLLRGRHEDRQLTDKKVGLLLRELGIIAKRCENGYRLLLDDFMRTKIHAIAKSYQVASMQGGIAFCQFCKPDESDKGTALK